MTGSNDETKRLELIVCASGPIEPLLNKPRWGLHRYPKPSEDYQELYCPTHKEIYERIKKQQEERRI